MFKRIKRQQIIQRSIHSPLASAKEMMNIVERNQDLSPMKIGILATPPMLRSKRRLLVIRKSISILTHLARVQVVNNFNFKLITILVRSLDRSQTQSGIITTMLRSKNGIHNIWMSIHSPLANAKEMMNIAERSQDWSLMKSGVLAILPMLNKRLQVIRKSILRPLARAKVMNNFNLKLITSAIKKQNLDRSLTKSGENATINMQLRKVANLPIPLSRKLPEFSNRQPLQHNQIQFAPLMVIVDNNYLGLMLWMLIRKWVKR